MTTDRLYDMTRVTQQKQLKVFFFISSLLNWQSSVHSSRKEKESII